MPDHFQSLKRPLGLQPGILEKDDVLCGNDEDEIKQRDIKAKISKSWP